ncbi:MAG TPA: acyl-CoA dehydrogenase family protein [Reyranella sp.]|nr:acyl-CoA dehydrogenase family protein [Reyranella sp.]
MSEWLAAARAVSVETASRHANDVDAGARFPAESFAALKARKLLGIMVPASEGGAGAGIADVVSICHALGQYCAPTLAKQPTVISYGADSAPRFSTPTTCSSRTTSRSSWRATTSC